MSLTKQAIPHEQIRALACREIQKEVDQITELHGGFFNTAFLIEFRDGERAVLKISPPPKVKLMRGEETLMQTEIEAIQAIASQSDLPVPHVLASRRGEGLVSGSYFFMRHISGVPLESCINVLAETALTRVYTKLGQFSRTLHGIRGSYFGNLHAPKRCWREFFLSAAEELFLDAEEIGAVYLTDLGEARAMFEASGYTLDEVKEPVLLHRDMWFGNIFLDPESCEITGVIDWERSLYGDPLLDFVFANLEGDFAREGVAVYYDGPASRLELRRAAFYLGYGKSECLSESEQLRIDLYTYYYLLLVTVEGFFRGYRDESQEQQAQDILARILARLKTRLAQCG